MLNREPFFVEAGSAVRKLFALVFLMAGLALILLCGPHARAQGLSAAKPTASPQPAPSPIALKKVPPTRYIQLGRSVNGSLIGATIFGIGKKRVLVFAGIHGDEPDSSIVAKALMVSLGQEAGLEDLTIIVVPDVNPDGLFANTRINARGVDINRNFPASSWNRDFPDTNHFPGSEPASEPETRAVMNLLEKYPPDYIITLHAALGCVNWDGTGEPLARVIAGVNNYPLCGYLGYDTPGSLGAYMGTDKRLPVVTIELRDVGAAELVQENLPALKAVLAYMAAAK